MDAPPTSRTVAVVVIFGVGAIVVFVAILGFCGCGFLLGGAF